MSLTLIIHHADSEAQRRDVMASIQFPTDDVQMFLVVNALTYHGAMRPTDVATMLGTGRANLSKIAQRLVEAGLVERLPDEEDGRSTLLALRPLGRAYGERIVARNEQFINDLLVEWSDDEARTLKRMLARLSRQWVASTQRSRPLRPLPPAPHP
ncbi:MarR family winged helix-turn-helix transcriptional regulator [Kocuria sp. U4B]